MGGWVGWLQGGLGGSGYGGTEADGSSSSGLFWADILKADTHNTEKCPCVLGFASFLCSDYSFLAQTYREGGLCVTAWP